MEKNYSHLGNVLSRQKLKQTYGGVEPGTWTCTFTFVNNTTIDLEISGENGNQAQCKADAICWGDNTCTGVDCASSGGC